MRKYFNIRLQKFRRNISDTSKVSDMYASPPSVFLLFFCYFLSLSAATAQEEHEYETIFSKKANRSFSNLRLFGGLNFMYIPIFQSNQNNHLRGAGFDINLSYKKKYLVGLNFTNIGAVPIDVSPQNPFTTIFADQLGLSLAYKPKPEQAFHALYSLRMGRLNAGVLTVKPNEPFTIETASGIFINPSVGVEANLFPWMGVQLNTGYNFVSSKNVLGINFQKNFSGIAFQIGVVLGNLR
jgi:hypothetical protein